MKKIELNHWFVEDSELSISLANYCVKISICKNNAYIYYQLKVFDNAANVLSFNFYALEDAINFTEGVIKNSFNKDEIINNYQIDFKHNKYKLPVKRLNKNDR